MRLSRFPVLLLLLLLGLAGCSPSMLTRADADWAKEKVAGPTLFARPADRVGERRILGGVILSVRQEPGRATIRLLAYPLDKKDYPETGKPALGPAIVLWSGAPLSTLFVSGNRLVVAGTVLSPGPDGTPRIRARVLSPDTCVSAGGFVCRRSFLGCSCHN